MNEAYKRYLNNKKFKKYKVIHECKVEEEKQTDEVLDGIFDEILNNAYTSAICNGYRENC